MLNILYLTADTTARLQHRQLLSKTKQL